MKKIFGALLLLQFFSFCGYSQVLKPSAKSRQVLSDSSKLSSKSTSNKAIKNKDAKIEQYLIIDYKGNTTFLDTSLTIYKQYKFNYLRKDNFALLPFANVGQTYNQLSKDFNNYKLLPDFGARARHYNYFEINDINYYEVPTPLTELFFKTAFQQGQILDAFFTVNTSRQFNFSIAYKGARSLGNYQHQITSTGNLRFTSNFKTKNKKYSAKVHIVTQDLSNEENGGIKDEDVANFESGDEDFLDRSVFDPNFENAENILVGKRFYLDHKYNLVKSDDSLTNAVSLKNIIYFEDKYFQFDQTTSNDFFGDSFNETNIRDRVTLENFYTKLLLNYKSSIIGDINLGVSFNDINYGYDKITLLDDEQIPNRIKDQVFSIEGSYLKNIDDFEFEFDFGANIIGDIDGSFFIADVTYNLNKDTVINGKVAVTSNKPNYNLLLNQSDYINYNWNNTEGFVNQNNIDFKLEFKSKKLLALSAQYTSIDNYSFFSFEGESNLIKPKQIEESIHILKIKANKEFKFGKFALENTILYQNVGDNSKSLNLPEFVFRNTFYYSNHFFNKNALYLQTGITFNYFTDYFMDGYDPLLAEFYSQNENEVDGFPRLDFFINAKIRQTRIFLIAEHFNSSFTGYNYFSAPNNPYRDFNIRFGLVWNFFL